MGEGSAAGVPWGDGLGTSGLESWEGPLWRTVRRGRGPGVGKRFRLRKCTIAVVFLIMLAAPSPLPGGQLGQDGRTSVREKDAIPPASHRPESRNRLRHAW